jgi:hypothetical protein
MRASDQILEHLDPSKVEDRYHRTEFDDMRLGDVTTWQIRHYLSNREAMEDHLDEESVFEEIRRLAMQSDEETSDWFDRITSGKHLTALGLAVEAEGCGLTRDGLNSIALGMLEDGWAEVEVRFALGTLGKDA